MATLTLSGKKTISADGSVTMQFEAANEKGETFVHSTAVLSVDGKTLSGETIQEAERDRKTGDILVTKYTWTAKREAVPDLTLAAKPKVAKPKAAKSTGEKSSKAKK